MLSVCLATYNGAHYIDEQLRSILPQLNAAEDEVVISDDGSTDDTCARIEAIRQQSKVSINLLHNVGPRGYTSNFENALRHARGEWIFLSDQDDVWLPNKLQQMLHALQQMPSDAPRLAVSNALITDQQLNVVHRDYFAARGVRRGLIGNIIKFGYLGCCLAFHRSLLHVALPFPANRRYCTHDNWLFLCAQSMGHVCIIDEPLMLYRRHGDTSTTGALNAHKPLTFRVAYRMYLMGQLALRRLRTK